MSINIAKTPKANGPIRCTLLGAALLILTAAHPGEHQAVTERVTLADPAVISVPTPEATVSAFHAALALGDVDAALAQLAEDVLIFESGNVERSRAEYAAHHLAADAAFSAAVKRTLINRTSAEDGNTAWVTSIENVTGTYRTRAINSRSVETMMLRRIDGQWRIAHIHWSSADI
ncbi:MAG: nuclear transport factor 2 family protein [Sphingorhabdus sp.]